MTDRQKSEAGQTFLWHCLLSLWHPNFFFSLPHLLFPNSQERISRTNSSLWLYFIAYFHSKDVCISVNVSVFAQKSESVLECIWKLEEDGKNFSSALRVTLVSKHLSYPSYPYLQGMISTLNDTKG